MKAWDLFSVFSPLWNRRAQMKDHFNALKKVVPSLQQKKHSNQSILKLSQKYIQVGIIRTEKSYGQSICF